MCFRLLFRGQQHNAAYEHRTTMYKNQLLATMKTLIMYVHHLHVQFYLVILCVINNNYDYIFRSMSKQKNDDKAVLRSIIQLYITT